MSVLCVCVHVDCLGCVVLLCLVCLFDLACFFLPSLIKTCTHVIQNKVDHITEKSKEVFEGLVSESTTHHDHEEVEDPGPAVSLLL